MEKILNKKLILQVYNFLVVNQILKNLQIEQKLIFMLYHIIMMKINKKIFFIL